MAAATNSPGPRQRSSKSSSTPARGTRKSPSSDGQSTAELLRSARTQFEEITGREVEAVSAFNKADDGWEFNVEVVELARIPDTTSVMATYAVRLESDGEFASYQRLRRYARGQIDV